MPNWKNIRKLRKHLATMKITEHRQFNMDDYIKVLSGSIKHGDVVSIARVRSNGESCGTAGCLAGEAIILLAPSDTRLTSGYGCNNFNALHVIDPISGLAQSGYTTGKNILGLNDSEATHMFNGHWTRTKHRGLHHITREQAVKYLDKAIKAKSILVKLS